MDANYYDYLTKLPTMTYFFESSSARKDTISKNGGEPALLFISLNGMKSYNQKSGFAGGNQYLQSFASLLSHYFESENCCRLGGVHFAVIADDTKVGDTLRVFLESCKNLDAEGGIFPHIGIYQFKGEDVSINIACDRAKLACDTLKNSTASEIAYYNQSIRHAEENHRYIIENLNKAIAERWITVYYQPIVRAVNGWVCDEEALARWIDPVKGFLSPADFIPVLEEEKLIYKLDLYVVERVLEKMKYLVSNGVPLLPQSINLSRSDFESCDIVEEIRMRVDLAGIPRGKISIEITESIIGSNFDFMLKQILRFKELGFPVWMDDFGAGYSSLNVLKEIPFDLIKFDMSFMRQFDEKNNGKIILAELMKMAFSIGADTVCEGVETEEQIQFLREIGCSKIQGYYYGKPIPFEEIIEHLNTKKFLCFENPDETHYYETIGRVNLHDLAVITYGNEKDFNNVFNMIPMAIVEVTDKVVRFVRTNQSYRNFFLRYFNMTLVGKDIPIEAVLQTSGATFMRTLLQVAEDGKRTFIDEALPDGSVANYFIRRLAENPLTKRTALAAGILSIRDSTHGTTYANIAKALAADYHTLFYVNLENEEFIEYSTLLGGEVMTTERHGENFFERCREDCRIYLLEEDQEMFIEAFTREKILKELNEQGRFSINYRQKNENGFFYANMKVMKMQQDSQHLIFAVSNVDSQMKQQAIIESIRQEKILYERLMALSDDFICMYIVDPKTEDFTEYNSSREYEEFGITKEGTDFFATSHKNAEKTLAPEHIELFKQKFTKENIMKEIARKGVFTLHYNLILAGEATPVSTKASLVKENGEDRLIVGIRR